jgi:hypothetical protein
LRDSLCPGYRPDGRVGPGHPAGLGPGDDSCCNSARHPPRKRGTQYAAASRSIATALEYWVSRSSPAMTVVVTQPDELQTCVRGPAARCARAVGKNFPPRRAWGMPGAQCAGSLACEWVVKTCTRVFTAVAPESPGIPARNGFTAYFALSPAIGLFATVASRIKVLSSPVEPNEPPQDLTPASRCQDHTTSPYADFFHPCQSHRAACRAEASAKPGEKKQRRRLACLKSLTESNPPCDLSHAQRCRVHRISSRVRDDRDTPLLWDETARLIEAISEKRKWNIFRYGTGQGKSHQI